MRICVGGNARCDAGSDDDQASPQPSPGWAPDPGWAGGWACTSHPGVLGSIPKQEEPVMGRLVHTGLGSSSLVAHVLHYPPPPHALCSTCSNKHTHSHAISPDLTICTLSKCDRDPEGPESCQSGARRPRRRSSVKFP